MAPSRVDINKKILKWAIRRAGHEREAYLIKHPVVKDWLEGTKKPTVKQLESIARQLHLPSGHFFLKVPPVEKLAFPFFRTGKSATRSVPLNVYDAVRIVQKRQDWMATYLEANGFEPLPFVGRFDVKTPVKEMVEDIRTQLKLSVQWAGEQASWQKALAFLTLQIEETGIVTNFSGIVGNNTKRPIRADQCRGFVLVDEYAPFMFINAADARAAQLFSLVHGLAHIWLGVSAGFNHKRLLPAKHPVETLCDQVAAEFLVPEEPLVSCWADQKDFKKLNRIFKVSPLLVARRALDLQLISKRAFFQVYKEYIQDIEDRKLRQGGGGNFYATAKKRISLRFAGFIHHAVKENKLPYGDAYSLTGLKGDTYTTFMKEYL